MNHTDFRWLAGSVIYWDMIEIDETRPLCDQSEDLKEDLAQIVFPNDILLDIGWFPTFDANGSFVVSVVQNSDWETPLFQGLAKDFESLRKQIAYGILMAGHQGKGEEKNED